MAKSARWWLAAFRPGHGGDRDSGPGQGADENVGSADGHRSFLIPAEM